MRLLDAKTEAGKLEEAARKQGEDIIQAVRGQMVLDLGWYHGRYVVLLVAGENWERPVSRTEAADLVTALEAFRKLLA